ncbi:hypothetical protein LTR36_004611 [Oleoguttula mirabilis]|uniref:N-acetyltransferase domain-containing protein n=1 Tax=Oleoguttula mirabilis TaxID=1507867 RepID=A0AAV9JGQ8_9PEZI|nr:hypothetical protein LTR36_004611 [Oleoguttula mirabilis]
MPRDLKAVAKEDGLQGAPQLTKSPEAVEGQLRNMDEDRSTAMDATDEDDAVERYRAEAGSTSKRDELHPYTQSLSPKDVESCTRLEEEAFPPHERCTREKFQYRLKHCGELSLGIFTSHSENQIPTAEAAAPVYSGAPDRKAVLIGHIIATKTTNPTVTDKDMAVPSPDDSKPDPSIGHKEEGRTICIHSLAVLPEYQKRGLGTTLMKAFLQRTESHDIADRVALIAHEHLMPYYESFGFVSKGESECKFGGGGWYDMVKDLEPGDKPSQYGGAE